MKKKIGIVNYGLGNVGSLYSSFKFYQYDVCLLEEPEKIASVDAIILGGVGNFSTAVKKIKGLNLWDAINKAVKVDKKPVLGICLGMQLFADLSYEDGENQGFGWIKGKVQKMDGSLVRLPHIGWNKVIPKKGTLLPMIDDMFFYFMHSHHFIPLNEEMVMATTPYGRINIVSAIKKDNIVGVQFHPEKSQGEGLRFIKNFVEMVR